MKKLIFSGEVRATVLDLGLGDLLIDLRLIRTLTRNMSHTPHAASY